MELCLCRVCCCQNISAKAIEIFLMVFHSIEVVLLLLNLIILKWSLLPIINLIMFLIIFCFHIPCLIFIIFIRIWRSKNTIKTTNKSKGIIFSNICFALLIISFIGCLIEDYALSYGISKANHPCRDKVNDYTISECKSLGKYHYEYNIPIGQIFLSYFTMSFLEVFTIIEIIFWYLLKNRIVFGLDGPQPAMSAVNQFGNPYGANVVVIQPSDRVYVGGQQVAGPYVYNNGPYPQQPYMANQAVPNQ